MALKGYLSGHETLLDLGCLENNVFHAVLDSYRGEVTPLSTVGVDGKKATLLLAVYAC
jgi:hypothetical protein